MATQEELILKQFAGARTGLAQKRKAATEELDTGLARRQAIGGLTGGAAIKAQQKGVQGLEDTFSNAEAGLSSQEAEQLRQAQAQKEAQAFQTSERESGQAFGSTEAEKQRGFGATEAEKQRTYGTTEREAGQQFGATQAEAQRQYGTSERLGAQDFGATQAERQRQYGTTERLAGQEFAGGEAGKNRAFAEVEAAKQAHQQQAQFESAFGLQQHQFDESKRQFDTQMQYQLSELAENKITNMINALTALKKSDLLDSGQYDSFIAKINQIRNSHL